MEEKKHSLLSPSAANRWLHCTPSAVAESTVEDESSIFALEGSLAHALCARDLLNRLGRDTKEVEEEIDRLSREYGCIEQEMEDHAAEYADYVMNLYESLAAEGRAGIHVETRLDLSDWAPGASGTADAVVTGGNAIHVIDYKYGRGVRVNAKGNAQMRMYALGVLDEIGMGAAVEEVHMTIYQPRLMAVSRESLTYAELKEWGDEYLRPLAEVAARGLGVRAAGSWCKFCKVKDSCPELDRCARIPEHLIPDRMDALRLGEECLPLIEPLEVWIESVKSLALTSLMQGETVPGFKMVRKRGRRVWTDAALVETRLKDRGFMHDEIYKPEELRNLTDIEKLMGKKVFAAEMGDLVLKKEGDYTIAADADYRPESTKKDLFDGVEI